MTADDAHSARWGRVLDRLETWLELRGPLPMGEPDWAAATAFRYVAFTRLGTECASLLAVSDLQGPALESLQGIDAQKERFVRNIAQFVQGHRANHVLLTGARGTGKSSLVKAVLPRFSSQGLRLVEIRKEHMADLLTVVDVLRTRPERFVVYCDDLSFQQQESGYQALKSILDGGVSNVASNVLMVATSNRRHLLPDLYQDNRQSRATDEGEIHPGEAVEEKISLSERFGLWLSFYPFTQDEYLHIVRAWLTAWLGPLDATQWHAVRAAALVWALERGSRSGRVAAQFAMDYVGRQGVAAAGGCDEPA